MSAIFFPQPSDLQPVLLKRGPVLVDGEEREMMLFTNGLVVSRIELDALVDLLMDASSGQSRASKTSLRQRRRASDDELCERFSELDTDRSGCECCLDI